MTHTAGELARYLGAIIHGDTQAPVSGLANPERAKPEELIYVDSPRHAARAAESAARCVLALPGTSLPGKTILEVENPKFAFAKAAAWLLPRPQLRPEIHPTAVVSASARLAPNIRVGPYVVIEDGVEIGSGTSVDAFCFLGNGARVGENCWLHPRVTLYAGARLKDRVEVHSGAVIGGDGFGYIFGDGHHLKFPQLGGVEIGDDVEIGCNATIDRGSLEQTQIGAGVKIDNLVQIAHNVRIGENSVVAAQVGISGSCSVGTRVLVAARSGSRRTASSKTMQLSAHRLAYRVARRYDADKRSGAHLHGRLSDSRSNMAGCHAYQNWQSECANWSRRRQANDERH